MLTDKMHESEETVGFRVVHIAFCQRALSSFSTVCWRWNPTMLSETFGSG
jgi:hypothetical protein